MATDPTVLTPDQWIELLRVTRLTAEERARIEGDVAGAISIGTIDRGVLGPNPTVEQIIAGFDSGLLDKNSRDNIGLVLAKDVRAGLLPGLATWLESPLEIVAGVVDWIKNAIKGSIEALNDPETWSAGFKRTMADIGGAELTRVGVEKKSVEWAMDKVLSSHDALREKIADLIVWEFRIITGLTLPVDSVFRITKGEAEPKGYAALGEPLFLFLVSQVQEARIIEGHLARDTGGGELVTISALMGASLRLQIGAQYIRHLAAALPSQFKQGVEQVAEMVDKAINLDDAIEDMIQEPLRGWVQQGLVKLVNRRTLPVDYSDTEVNQLFLADKITGDIRHKVLDNLGVRDDIRDNLLDLAAPNLTESDIDQAYQHNLLSADQVKATYQDKSFREPERSIKTELVLKQRRWKLEEKVFELYGNLYRDGVATREEVTPHLEHFGYEADEVDMWFQVQELERRQRRWLTKSDLSALIKSQQLTVQQARDYMVLQGMTGSDATMLFVEEITVEAIKALPKAVRDECAEILDPEAILKGLLGELLQLTGLGTLADAKTLKLIQCLFDKIGGTTP